MKSEEAARYEAMIHAAKEAGRIALRHYPDLASTAFAHQIIWKSDQSPVTIADRDAESHLRQVLLQAFPEDGFLGEEHGEVASRSGFRWIVDPIDGTRSFVRGVPHWATLIGLEYRGETVAGVVYEPVFDRMFHALRGEGAYRNGERLRVSKIAQLEHAGMFFSALSWFQRAGKETEFLTLLRRTERQQGFGDYYGHMLVAQGAGEFMPEYGVHAWDVAAIKPIVEEAGGRFSDWDDQPNIHRPDCLTSNGVIHQSVLDVLRGHG